MTFISGTVPGFSILAMRLERSRILTSIPMIIGFLSSILSRNARLTEKVDGSKFYGVFWFSLYTEPF